ncbi:MAG: response regulator [Chloroflexota bacterium]
MISSILLIEHDNILCDLIQLTLERQGYHVFVANTTDEILTLFQQHSPRVILLDLFLPQINVLALIRQLKSIPQATETSIILLSAFGYREVIQQAIEAGAQDYLLKPINPDILVERITKALTETNPGGKTETNPNQRNVTKPNFRRMG